MYNVSPVLLQNMTWDSPESNWLKDRVISLCCNTYFLRNNKIKEYELNKITTKQWQLVCKNMIKYAQRWEVGFHRYYYDDYLQYVLKARFWTSKNWQNQLEMFVNWELVKYDE